MDATPLLDLFLVVVTAQCLKDLAPFASRRFSTTLVERWPRAAASFRRYWRLVLNLAAVLALAASFQYLMPRLASKRPKDFLVLVFYVLWFGYWVWELVGSVRTLLHPTRTKEA